MLKQIITTENITAKHKFTNTAKRNNYHAESSWNRWWISNHQDIAPGQPAIIYCSIGAAGFLEKRAFRFRRVSEEICHFIRKSPKTESEKAITTLKVLGIHG